MPNEYTMTISRLTVDKLGIKLYDRVSAVIAELVANSYDADAAKVTVKAPMGEYLATRSNGQLIDKGHAIQIIDDGIGMTPKEVNKFYLKVGAERRKDEKRGDVSKKYKRRVMGNKGVGKLAPFGVCSKIEVITSGGEKIRGRDKEGNQIEGYETAHLILEKAEMLTDTETAYKPIPGKDDGTVSAGSGTTLILTEFDHRRVPRLEDFERQLARRFGISSGNWEITLEDSLKTGTAGDFSRVVGEFSVETMENTRLRFEHEAGSYQVVDEDGSQVTALSAGFEVEGSFYPVTGWVGYSKKPYKDDLMAGVRIYCRGKIAAQTAVFNMKAGFTGEYDIRSYLVGELHADWLDKEEDLIRTDRQDILWSHDLGHGFEEWGQGVTKHIGSISRKPRKKRAWDLFKDLTDIEGVTSSTYPGDNKRVIRENTIEIAKSIASTARVDELQNNKEHVKSIVELSLLIGPHITLDQSLRKAGEESDSPLAAITNILKTARIAELSSFGRIADDRVKVIQRVEELKDDKNTLEDAFQDLITEAPWLVNPQWAPITSNQTFTTLKSEFEKYYKEKTGEDLNLGSFRKTGKRADFVMLSQQNEIQLVEIKRPKHELSNGEMDRLYTYVTNMHDFLEAPGQGKFKALFPTYKVTLVCDELNLTGMHKDVFEGFVEKGILEHMNWRVFLLNTRRMHQAFLNEAEEQKRRALES